MRTYEASHPAVARTLDRLMERLRAYWQEWGDLEVTLEPTAVVLGDKIVHQADSPGLHAWFPFYASGIRQLTIKRGMSREDIFKLLQVGNQFRGLREQDFAEDDVVTALWELNLESVETTIAPSYGEDVDRARDTVEKVRAFSDLAMKSIPIDGDTADILIDHNDRLRWAERLCTEPNAGFRYVEALFVALESKPSKLAHERLCDLISAELGMAIDGGMFGVAERILSYLDVRPDLLEKSLDARVVLALLETYAKTVSDAIEEPIEAILRRCPHHARTILEAALDLSPVKQRRLLMCAMSFGDVACLCARDLLKRASDQAAEALVSMVVKIPGPAAREALLVATEHDFYRVRGLAYQTLFEDKSVKPDRDLILRTLDDEHSLVRQCALEYLQEARPKEAREWLEAQADSFDFNQYEPAEQKRLYSTLAAVAGEALIPWLEAKLSRNNFKLYSSDAERVCAIAALTELRAQSCRPLLEKMARSWLSKSVREAAKKALEILDTPVVVRPVRRRTFGSTWGESGYTGRPATLPPPVAASESVSLPPPVLPREPEIEGSGTVPLAGNVVEQTRRELRARSARKTEPPPMPETPSLSFDQVNALGPRADENDAENEVSYSFVAVRETRRSRARRPTEQETAPRAVRESQPPQIRTGDGELGSTVYVSSKPRGKRTTRRPSDDGENGDE